MSSRCIIVISPEGHNLEKSYNFMRGMKNMNLDARVRFFNQARAYCLTKNRAKLCRSFVDNLELSYGEKLEIHAYGGFGASVAYEITSVASKYIERVFFIGGAPSDCLRFFPRMMFLSGSKHWVYTSFARLSEQHSLCPTDDDVSLCDIQSVKTFCANAEKDHTIYSAQLKIAGRFSPFLDLKKLKTYRDSYIKYYFENCNIKAFYIPNSEHECVDWLNPYRGGPASDAWAKYGVKTLDIPSKSFSQYMLYDTTSALMGTIAYARRAY